MADTGRASDIRPHRSFPQKPIHEDKEWNFGTVRLTVAVLPYDITDAYYRQTGRDHQAVKELVAKSGWKNTDLGHAEIGYFGESYEHKYARIWAQHLDL